MNKIHLTALATFILSSPCLQAQNYLTFYYPLLAPRVTYVGNPVIVLRTTNESYFSGSGAPNTNAARILDDEQLYQQLCPEAKLLVSGTAYMFKRNCHDFTFAPWMTWGDGYPYSLAQDKNGTTYSYYDLGPQKEAWVMDFLIYGQPAPQTWPNQNWWDTSMVDDFESATGPGGGGPEAPDFLFNTSDLDPLQYEYEDFYGSMSGLLQNNPRGMIGLPVCPLVTRNDNPVHSAILVDWFEPEAFGESISAGIFISKWGNGGIWEHRWGYGLCPDLYCPSTALLHVFVPNNNWGGLMYWVFYSPW